MYVVLLRYCVIGLVIFAAENCADSQKSAVHPKEREKAALMIQRAKLQIRRRRQESSKIVKENNEAANFDGESVSALIKSHV